jgi:hypothetical protein
VEYGPDGLQFLQPVRIGVPYSDAGVSDELLLGIQTYDPVSGEWKEVAVVERDTAANILYAEVSHFSLYQAAGPAGPTAPGAPYFNWGILWYTTTSGGAGATILADIRDPDGAVPDTIQSFEAIDPFDVVQYQFKKGDYYFDTALKLERDRGNLDAVHEFYLKWMPLPGPMVTGEYTARAMDTDGNVVELKKWLNVDPLPLVDAASIRIRNQATGMWEPAIQFQHVDTTQPLSFTWFPVKYGSKPVFYRVVIENWNSTPIYRSLRSADIEVTIPAEVVSQILVPHAAYRVRVEAYDKKSGRDASNRSNSDKAPFTTGTLSFNSGPFLQYAFGNVSQFSSPPVPELRAWVGVKNGWQGPVMTDAQVSVTVETPDLLTLPLEYNPPWSEFWLSRSELLPGRYLFRAVDGAGNQVQLLDYLDRTHVLPVPTGIDPVPYSASSNTTPLFSWGFLDEPKAFNVTVERWDGAIWQPVHNGPRIEDTSYPLPPGVLALGNRYRWRVRGHDGDNAGTSDSRAYGDLHEFFVTNPPATLPVAAIVADDGDTSEWGGIPPVAASPAGCNRNPSGCLPGNDFRSVSVARDAPGGVYFLVELSGPPDTTGTVHYILRPGWAAGFSTIDVFYSGTGAIYTVACYDPANNPVACNGLSMSAGNFLEVGVDFLPLGIEDTVAVDGGSWDPVFLDVDEFKAPVPVLYQ